MKTISIYFIAFSILTSILFISCEKDDPVIPNQEELITTLIYTLTPVDNGTNKVFKFTDLDGNGSGKPFVMTDTLSANTTYEASIVLLNELETPADTISNEVLEENDEHQFFFSTGSGLNLSVDYDDTDANGNPVGLSGVLTTVAVSKGKLKIILRHEPDKFASGVSGGDITNAGGETDIEVEFDVVIE